MEPRLAGRVRGDIPVGANIGMNKGTAAPLDDYLLGLERLGPHADYITLNVSSPNTPGLRALQGERALRELLEPLMARCRTLGSSLGRRPPPLLVKIAPDLTEADAAAIAAVALETGVAGLIVGNTTVDRHATLRSPRRVEAGGLSGRPLMTPSTELLRRMRHLVGDRLTLVGVGGIFTAADVWAKIRAGADAVQLYTGLVYLGPGLVRSLVQGLREHLDESGLPDLRAAVGIDA